MKNLIALFLCVLSLNASAGFSFNNPPGISFPDFNDFEQSQKIFMETVETLTESLEVASIVAKVEDTHRTTCVALQDKASRGLVWFKLNYRCEGEKDFKLSVKARLKNDKVLVKEYKVKL